MGLVFLFTLLLPSLQSVEEATTLREALAREKQLHKDTQQKLAAAEKVSDVK